MTNYPEREVNTAIRRLQSSINELINTSYATYKTKIKSFVELTTTNPIIFSIVQPLREIEVDLDKINNNDNNGMFINSLKLPLKHEERVAYVLKVFDLVANNEISLENYTLRIYKHKRYEDNINKFMQEIVRPELIELVYTLNDLQKYDVEGKEVISESALQIINHGTINASQGSSISMGKEIQTTINYNNVSNKIIEEVRKQGIVAEENLREVEIIAEEVEAELILPIPSPGKLKQLSQKVYDIGEKALLKTFSTVLNDPRWGQAALDTILNS